MSQKEVQALIWAALKWVIGVGLALAFSMGAWASNLRADVNHALERTSTVSQVKEQVDSLRIEMRHMSEQNTEILTYLKHGK